MPQRLGTDGSSYALNGPNVARELASNLSSNFVKDGSAFIPGVLRATHSTSVYAHAATLELATWSSINTTSFDAASTSSLYVWVAGGPTEDVRGGKVAKALFDAMTKVPEVAENGAMVRRSSKRSVTCARYTDTYQCVVGPFSNVQQQSGCPK